MNAPRFDPYRRPRPTHTFWPGPRRPEPKPAPPAHDAAREEKEDDDRAHEEPGYGHGV